jgi:hypothetical protein
VIDLRGFPSRWKIMTTSARLTIHISIMFAMALAIAPATARAELKVVGDAESIIVEAQNTSIEEILSALSGKFNLRYRSSANLGGQVTGTYRGTLRDVVMRILAGRSFFINSTAGVMEVTVLERAPTVSTPMQAPRAPQGQSPQMLPKLGQGREGPAPVPTPESTLSLPVPVPGTPIPVPPPMPAPANALPMPIPQPFSNLPPGNVFTRPDAGSLTPSGSAGH